MPSVYETIREHQQKRDKRELQAYLVKLDEDDLVDVIKQAIQTATFGEIWNQILSSFGNSAECHKKRLSVVLCFLKQIEEKNLSPSLISSIMNPLCLELTKFKSEDLAKLCSFCLEYIQSRRTTKMGWKDVLPELLNVLMERETFTFDELDYTGAEYKTDFINTLCMTNWAPNIVTTLAAMFIEMPLTKDEHLKVVNKLGTYMEKLIPQEIPSFVYQLLKLCKQQNGRIIFLRLQNYFGLRIYNNANLVNESSPETNSNLDVIESTSNQETIAAEGTVLYHIHTSASLGHECIKDYLNSIKNMVKAPELVLHPFQLMVLFTISTVPRYEDNVYDIVRPCIVRFYNDEQRRSNSCWFKDMVPTVPKPEEVFSQVIHFCLQERELILPALVNFAFVLLGVGSALGRDPIAEQQWNLGNVILLKIIKRKSAVATSILQTLSNHVVTRQSPSQYIECLYILSKTLPLLMIENQSCIVELIDSLVQIQGQTANQLLDALMPLTKVSPSIRDHLIILLRKSLYSRSVETRQMAVNGFLKMVAQLKLSNLTSLSQNNGSSSFSSGHSIYTQLSMNRTSQTQAASKFSNESLCLEILSILRRCFMQQAEVRAQLYDGLYRAVCMNPELGIPALDIIWLHFSVYYVMDNEQLPPLNFKKIAVTRGAESILQEPLGKLIYTIGMIVTKVSENEDNRENNTVVKFVNILDLLSDRMRNCELVHFELDDGSDLLDVVPESQLKMQILKEAMSTYEALIGFKFFSWNERSEDQGQMINTLFQGYGRLVHFSKTLSKPKKADSKKKKGDKNKTTQQTQTQANATAKKEAQKQLKNFKTPNTVLDFETVIKALLLLHEQKVSWTTATGANVVKSKRELHQHIMQATLHLLQSVKRRKDIDGNAKQLCYNHITEVARVIFTRIIKRLSEFIDFDCSTAILSLECFNIILTLMSTHYKSNMRQFLTKVVNGEEDAIVPQLQVIVETYQKIFELDEEETSDDPEIKKLSFVVANTLGTLVSHIPSDSNVLLVQFFEWLKAFAYNNTLSAKVSTVVAGVFFETHMRYKVSLTLLQNISISIGNVIGVITEEDQNVEQFKMIDEGTVHNILLCLCNCVKSMLEDVDAVITRLKSEFTMLSYPGVDNIEKRKENLRTKEMGIFCQLCFIVTILTNMNNILIQPGNISEAIFKSDMQLFNTLCALTKHFIMRSSKTNLAFEGARFERLVKLAGKQLAPAIYQLIMHLEGSQKQDTQATQNKKKNVDSAVLKNKVLKETRLIPKVVYEIEQFSKCVIQLSNKTKVDLAKYVGQGTVRDFRIKDLREVLEQVGGADNSHPPQLDDTLTEASMEAEESVDRENEEGESFAASPPPSKRSKR